jgi:predicted ABC-type ATPase
LKASIRAHQTIGVETVLSTSKYRKLVRLAKIQGFEIVLVYVLLKSPALHVARVALRVKKGGHSVPTKKILARRTRSLRQLPWFLRNADIAWLFDNSGATPLLVGWKENNELVVLGDAPPEYFEAAKKSLKS